MAARLRWRRDYAENLINRAYRDRGMNPAREPRGIYSPLVKPICRRLRQPAGFYEIKLSAMNRKLLGPTVIVTLASLLLLQQWVFADSSWSVLAIIMRVVSTLVTIVTPPEPVTKFFFEHLALPTLLIGLALLALWLLLVGGKKAMRQVTPEVGSSSWLAPAGREPGVESESPLLAETSWSMQTFRFNCLRSKLILSFVAIGAFITIAACSIAYSYLHRALARAATERAAIMALAVNTTASAHVSGRRFKELRDDLARAVAQPTVAYAYVEDGGGKLIEYAPADLPSQLVKRPGLDPQQAVAANPARYRNEMVIDHAQRSAVAPRSVAHVGFWQDSVSAQTWAILGPILLVVFVVVLGVAGLFVYLIRDIHRQLLSLVEQSARISKGEFTVPLVTSRADELGDLARSVERMRSSLRAVLSRVGSEPPVTQSRRGQV